MASPTCVAYVLLIRDGGGRILVKTFLNLTHFHNFSGFPATPWDNLLFAQKVDVVRVMGGFTHFNLVEYTNDIFNLTENVLNLVVEDVTAALEALDVPEDILDTVDPAAVKVEEIYVEEIWIRKSIPLGVQLSQLKIGRDLTPQEFWNQICVLILNTPTIHVECQHVVNWGLMAVT